jgi:uncharacterized membrane protein YdjX (TVP38/TMEM64 family)
MGMIFPSWAIGAAISLFLSGALFDLKGNYTLAFWVSAIAMVIGALMAFLVKRYPQENAP